MAKNPTNFTFNNGGYPADFADAFVRLDLFSDGGLWLWGQNFFGQLGNNSTTSVSVGISSPIQTIAGGTNWKQVAGGVHYTAAIKTDGTLWLFGHNAYGTLGDNTVVHKSSPVQTVSGGTNWKQITGGNNHSVAIKTDGTLWLWGRNNYGQLGDNSVTPKSSPVQTIAGGTNWKLVSCGTHTTAAIKTDGTLWTWGNNGFGQLGDGSSVVHRSSPIQTVAGGTNWKQVVVAGDGSTAAIKTDGTLWTWGWNLYGQLGDNTTTAKSSPIQTVAAGTNWKSVAGGYRNIAAIKNDGTLWLWGFNYDGQLGDNTRTNRSSPVQTVSAGTNWKSVAGGDSGQMVAIKTDGTLWMWGYGFYGILGDNTVASKSSPVQTVAGGTNWKSMIFKAGSHTAVISNIT